VLYYACDANFLGFFGSTVWWPSIRLLHPHSSLTNVDAYSTPLTEFPLDSTSINYSADRLGVTDLERFHLHECDVMQELGLADPIRYVGRCKSAGIQSAACCKRPTLRQTAVEDGRTSVLIGHHPPLEPKKAPNIGVASQGIIETNGCVPAVSLSNDSSAFRRFAAQGY